MRTAVLLGIGLTLTSLLLDCERPAPAPQETRPPLKVTFRKSQVPGQGMVANVNNPASTGSIKLFAVFVQGKDEKEERSYRSDREIKALDSITVGWAELGGWKLKPGDKLRLRCEGYSDDLMCDVPE